MILKAIIGLSIGLIFGYTLQRAGVTKYPRVTGMLMLKDFKILKFMLTAVISSMIGFHLLGDLDLLEIMPKSLDWGKVVGGLIFGLGMGTLGYCPGTLAARIGEGKKDALLALFSTAAGIFLFGVNMTAIQSVLGTGSIKATLFTLSGGNKWVVILTTAAVFSSLILFLEKKHIKTSGSF